MRLSADWWAYWAGVCAVGLTAAAAITGIVAWYFSNIAAVETSARTSALELKVSEQQERAAKAEAELLELQERARARTLDAGARASIIEWLKGRSADSIRMWSPSAPEPIAYKHQIRDAIIEAGWTVTKTEASPQMGNPTVGIKVWFNADEPPTTALVLQRALRAAGLIAPIERTNNARPGEVILAVGLKP